MAQATETHLTKQYREGAKRLYGKIFWRCVDYWRGDQSKRKFSEDVLRLDPSRFSCGIDDGSVALDTVIFVLVALEKNVPQLPQIPKRQLLAIAGYREAMFSMGARPTLEQLCCTVAMWLDEKWFVIRREALSAQTDRLRQSLSEMSKKMQNRIESEANILLSEYLALVPDEHVGHSPVRLRTTAEYDKIWQRWGTELKRCVDSISNYDGLNRNE